MMIKFLQHGRGNPRLAAAYLLDDVDHLNLPRAGVDVLSGDPYTFSALCESSPHKWKYTSGVIAWSAEDQVSDDEVKKVIREFEEYAFAGLEPHRYHLLAVMHKEQDGGKHVHILVPRIDLETGKSLNIAPPGHHKYFDCFRDYQNYKHGWTRPDDPNRFKMTQEPNHVSLQRKAALKAGESTPQPRFEQLLEEQLLMAIAFNEIKDHQDVCRYIQMMPGVTAVEPSKNAKTPYIAVKLEGQEKRIRLKGPLYEPTFSIDVYLQDSRAKQPTRRAPPQDQHVRISYYGRYRKAYEQRREYHQQMYSSPARHRITGEQYAENVELDPTRNASLANRSGANGSKQFENHTARHRTGSEARRALNLDQEQPSRHHRIERTDPSRNAPSDDRDSSRMQGFGQYNAVRNATTQGRDSTLTPREPRNAEVLQGAQAESIPTGIRGSEETSTRNLHDDWAVRFSRFSRSAKSVSRLNDPNKFRCDHEAKATTYLSDLSTSLLKENQDEQRIRRLIAHANGAIDRAKQTLERTKSIIGKEESAITNRESEYQTIQSRHARFRQNLADSSRAIQNIEYELYRRYTYFNAESDTSFHTRQHHEKFERTLENASADFGRRFACKHAAEDSTSHQRNDGTQFKTHDHITRTRSFRLEASDQKLIKRALDIFSLRQRARRQRNDDYDFEM
jgi:hypothetical protein